MAKKICFVESIDTGKFIPAIFKAEQIGPEVWRQRSFAGAAELMDLDAQDLWDIAGELHIPREGKTKGETAQMVWDRSIQSMASYSRTREQSAEFLERSLRKMAKASTKTKRVRKTKTEPQEGAGRGRPSELAGKKIYVKVEGNPRRPGTHGHKSFGKIKHGMTVEDYGAAGGRMADLRWDITAGHVEVK